MPAKTYVVEHEESIVPPTNAISWFEETPGDGTRAFPAEGQDLAARVGHLFGAVRHPGTGEPYTGADVAR